MPEAFFALFLAGLVTAVGLPFAMRRSVRTDGHRLTTLAALPDRARIVVLGCHVENADGHPNRLFTARVAAGAAAYHALSSRSDATRPSVLASGFGRLGETEALREQLVLANVPRDVIELDPAGERTIRTIEFLAQHPDDRPIVLVSQRFHLPRALWLARRLGVEAVGLPAAGGIGGVRARLREHLAWLRAIIDVARG